MTFNNNLQDLKKEYEKLIECENAKKQIYEDMATTSYRKVIYYEKKVNDVIIIQKEIDKILKNIEDLEKYGGIENG